MLWFELSLTHTGRGSQKVAKAGGSKQRGTERTFKSRDLVSRRVLWRPAIYPRAFLFGKSTTYNSAFREVPW
jgi:hypothetical protein